MEWITCNWEAIVAISSVIIALCAFGLTICQHLNTVRHNKLSFRPTVSDHKSSVDDPDSDQYQIKLELQSGGPGPAKIIKAQLKHNTQKIDLFSNPDSEKFFKGIILENKFDYQNSQIDKFYWLPSGYSMPVYTLYLRKSETTTQRVDQIMTEISIEFEYESIYGEKFSPSKKP